MHDARIRGGLFFFLNEWLLAKIKYCCSQIVSDSSFHTPIEICAVLDEKYMRSCSHTRRRLNSYRLWILSCSQFILYIPFSVCICFYWERSLGLPELQCVMLCRDGAKTDPYTQGSFSQEQCEIAHFSLFRMKVVPALPYFLFLSSSPFPLSFLPMS